MKIGGNNASDFSLVSLQRGGNVWLASENAGLELIGGQDQRQSLVRGVLSIRGISGLLVVDEIILGECVDQERLVQSQDLGEYSHYRLVLEHETGKDGRKNGHRNSMKNLCHQSCQGAPKALPPPRSQEKER